MVRQRIVLLAVMVLTLASTTPAQTKPSLDDLGWLSGCWEGRVRDAVIEEIWSKPGGMSMLGLGRTVKENRTVSFEFMQIREENGTLVFSYLNRRVALVFLFLLKIFLKGKATFENKRTRLPPASDLRAKGHGIAFSEHRGYLQRKKRGAKSFKCEKFAAIEIFKLRRRNKKP